MPIIVFHEPFLTPLPPEVPPLPALMDSSFIHSSVQDSRRPRSSTKSHLSSTASQFSALHIDSDATATSHPLKTQTSPPNHPGSTGGITAPVPQPYTTFPLLSQNNAEPNWSYLNSTGEQPSTHLHHIQSPQPFVKEDQSIRHQISPRPSSGPTSNPANMT